MTETTGGVGHAFLDRAWDEFGLDGLITPTRDLLLVEYFLEIFGGTLSSQKGKELVHEIGGGSFHLRGNGPHK